MKTLFPVCGLIVTCLGLFCLPQAIFAQDGLARGSSEVVSPEFDEGDKAQSALFPEFGQFVYLFQGERRELTKDFAVQLDGDLLRVSLESAGLAPAVNKNDLVVSLIQPTGQRQDLRPGIDGRVVFESVPKGLAAIVVTADSALTSTAAALYAAIPFYVTDNAPNAPLEAEKNLPVPLALVNPAEVAEGIAANAPSTPPMAGAGAGANELMTANDFQFVAPSRFRVQRLADGSVQGQVVVPQRGYLAIPGITRIVFYRGGRVVASTDSNSEGYFVAQNVPVGVNSLVATGPSGHAAYNVEIIERGQLMTSNNQSNSESQTRLVSFRAAQQASNQLIVFLIPPALMDQVRQIAAERLPAPIGGVPLAAPLGGLPMAGMGAAAGAGGGGYGGGGAGGGGLGGLPLLGLAGLAGVAAVAIADDDDDNFNPPVASPITFQQ